jgi:hypothetical protein
MSRAAVCEVKDPGGFACDELGDSLGQLARIGRRPHLVCDHGEQDAPVHLNRHG